MKFLHNQFKSLAFVICKRRFSIYAIAMCVVVISGNASMCLASQVREQKAMDKATEADAYRIANKYVLEVKKWAANDYRLSLDQIDKEKIIIRVSHTHDLAAKHAGGGKSIAVIIDSMSMTVIGELRYQ